MTHSWNLFLVDFQAASLAEAFPEPCQAFNPRSSHQRCSIKKVFLEFSLNWQENTCAKVSFFNKLQTLAQVFSWEFCKISKNAFFYRTPLFLLTFLGAPQNWGGRGGSEKPPTIFLNRLFIVIKFGTCIGTHKRNKMMKFP